MIDIEKDLKEYGLTEERYEECLSDIRKKVNGDIDIDWAEIVEKYNLGLHRDTLRKASQTIFGAAFVSEYLNQKAANDGTKSYLLQLKLETEQLKRERQKLRDEKLEYNRWLREHSRDELIGEKICDAIAAIEPLSLPQPILKDESQRTYILCFADTHYGTEFEIAGLNGEIINKYSPEIFESRMATLMMQVLDVVFEKNLTNIKIFSLGDELDGILRVSQLQKLRYGIIESTIKYSEYICNWLNELSKYVTIDFYTVQGNHTELRLISQPKGTFTDENMSSVINEFIKERLKDNPNFSYHKNESGLIYDNICGYNILGIHGEVKNMATALQKFTNTYGMMIDVLVGGHKHHFQAETIGRNKDIISVPSIMGIDDYSMSIGKTSNPGATMFVVERTKGVIEEKHFKF